MFCISFISYKYAQCEDEFIHHNKIKNEINIYIIIFYINIWEVSYIYNIYLSIDFVLIKFYLFFIIIYDQNSYFCFDYYKII